MAQFNQIFPCLVFLSNSTQFAPVPLAALHLKCFCNDQSFNFRFLLLFHGLYANVNERPCCLLHLFLLLLLVFFFPPLFHPLALSFSCFLLSLHSSSSHIAYFLAGDTKWFLHYFPWFEGKLLKLVPCHLIPLSWEKNKGLTARSELWDLDLSQTSSWMSNKSLFFFWASISSSIKLE